MKPWLDDGDVQLYHGDALEVYCPRPSAVTMPTQPQTVLDPFIGSGTTALVARKHGRRCIGIDLNESYLGIAARRLGQQSLFASHPSAGSAANE